MFYLIEKKFQKHNYNILIINNIFAKMSYIKYSKVVSIAIFLCKKIVNFIITKLALLKNKKQKYEQ